MSELLINDYTRKGFVDGLCVRLPTICIRPGKPNKATSSFVSSIIREPLHGETSICPVAEKMAFSFIKFLGKKKEEWALAITGYVVSIPIFVDSAFVILYPVAKALAKNGKRSLLTLGVALAGGLVVTHHTVPPTPGPLGVAGLFGVDIGAMLLVGMAFTVLPVIGVVFYAKWLNKKYPTFNQETFSMEELKQKYDDYIEKYEQKNLPSLGLSLLPIVLPILLIFIKAILDLGK